MTTATHRPDGAHPIVWFGARVHAVLDELTDIPAWSMTPTEQRTALIDLARAEARIDELRLRVLAAADRSDIAAEHAATSTTAWLAVLTGTTRAQAHADVKLALALDTDYPQTRRALAAGHVNPAQARVIVRALGVLPDGIDASLRERAEKQLLADAADHDANALRWLGRRVFEVVDPERADLEEGRRLEREEQAAARATYLHLCDNRDGTHTGRFKISTLHTEMLRRPCTPYRPDAPARRHPSFHPSRRPATIRRRAWSRHPGRSGHRSRTGAVRPGPQSNPPRADGTRVLRASGTVPGSPAAQGRRHLGHRAGDARLRQAADRAGNRAPRHRRPDLRRLACTSGLIPVVYRKAVDGRSVVLDMGRRRRLHDEYQRMAFAVRDRGCTTLGCDRPAAWCHAHHDIPWSEGGGTSVTRGRLLCGYHHRKAHSPIYTMTHRHDGKVEFHRRT